MSATNRRATGRILTAGIALAVGLSSGAQIVPAAGGHWLLKAKYSPGEQFRYVATAVIKNVEDPSTGNLYDVTFPVILKVKRLRQGIATLSRRYDSPHHDDKRHQKTSMLDFQGTVAGQVDVFNKKVSGEDMGVLVARFPNHPIAVGDKWKGLMTFDFGGGKAKAVVSTESRLNGILQEGKKQVAYIVMQLFGLASGTGRIYVDTKDGTVISSSLDIQIHTFSQGSVPVTLTLKRTQ